MDRLRQALGNLIGKGQEQTDDDSLKNDISLNKEGPPPIGIAEPLHDHPEAEIDIIAVHGLNGHRDNTWTSKGINWLQEFVPQVLPRSRVLVYGYDSRTHGSTPLSRSTLNQIGADFLSELSLMRQDDDTERRPIIFLAHSLGGIVVKSALIQSHNRTESHMKKQRSVKLSTHGVMFFGTPHCGTDDVTLAQACLQILSLYQRTNDTILQHLTDQSEWLQDQLDSYKSISGDFVTVFFFEQYETTIIGRASRLIVPRSSAVVPGMVNADVMAIKKDHREMVRFSTSEDPDFKNVARQLRLMAKAATDSVTQKWVDVDSSSSSSKRMTYDLKNEITMENWILKLRSNPVFVVKHELRSQTRFIARSGIDDRLHAMVFTEETSPLVLYGAPGTGKTELALHFAHTNQEKYNSIFWIDASSMETVQNGFLRVGQAILEANATSAPRRPPPYGMIADLLGLATFIDESGLLSAKDLQNIDHIVGIILKWFNDSRNHPWLLIFDNHDEPESFTLRNYFPQNNLGTIMVTTRRRDFARVGRGVEVVNCTKMEGLQVLMNACQRSPDQILHPQETIEAECILKELDYSPLALEHAGSYIFNEGISFRGYLDLWRTEFSSVTKTALPRHVSDYNMSIYVTYDVSFQRLEKIDKAASQFLSRCSFYSANDIPRALVNAVRESSKGMNDRSGSILSSLTSHSFLKRSSTDDFSIHPLIHTWIRERLDADDKYQAALDAFQSLVSVIRLANDFGNIHPSSKQWLLQRASMLHVEASLGWLSQLAPKGDHHHPATLYMAYRELASVYAVHNQFQKSEMLYDLALSYFSKTSGPHSRDTALTQMWLGRMKGLDHRLKEGEALLKQSLPILEREFSRDSVEYSQGTCALGHILFDQGHYPKALELFEGTLNFIGYEFGTESQEVCWVESYIALVCKALGDLEKAETFGRRSLRGAIEAFGDEHPTTIRRHQHLALIFGAQEKWDVGIPILESVLEFRSKVDGETGPSTLRVLHNLAYFHFRKGDFSQAGSLSKVLLAALKSSLADNASPVVNARELLGAIELGLGCLEDSYKNLDTVRVHLESGGIQSPAQYYRVLVWLGKVHMAGGDHKAAKTKLRRALDGQIELGLEGTAVVEETKRLLSECVL